MFSISLKKNFQSNTISVTLRSDFFDVSVQENRLFSGRVAVYPSTVHKKMRFYGQVN